MKVVINKCYGGFSLSHKAMMMYAKLKRFKLYSFIDERELHNFIGPEKFIPYKAQKGQKKLWLIHYSKKPLVKGKHKEKYYFTDHDIDRDDKTLVKIVEKLGIKADGRHAKLKVVKIPDGTKYIIDEYDGIESIHEKHNVWG